MTHRLRLRRALDAVRRSCDVRERREADPVSFVHRYSDPHDQELMGLLASSLAFGNVTTIRKKLEELSRVLGASPKLAAERSDLPRALRSFRHRLFVGDDIARLLLGARVVQKEHGSLGAFFRFCLREDAADPMRAALARFVQGIRAAGRFPKGGARRGPRHLLPDPDKGGACKRLFLFLRWMVRPSDGVDLGLWDIPPGRLVCPVDTHLSKLGYNLGLTDRRVADYRAAQEITAGLCQLDPEDPVKYDFALCHLGMLQRCPSRRDPERCEGCPVRPLCRHWGPLTVR